MSLSKSPMALLYKAHLVVIFLGKASRDNNPWVLACSISHLKDNLNGITSFTFFLEYLEDVIPSLIVLNIYWEIRCQPTSFPLWMTLSSFLAVSEIIIMGPFSQIQMALVICRFRSSFIAVHFLEYGFKHSFCPTFVFLLQGHRVCVLCILNIDPTPLNSLVKCHEKWEPPLWIKHL